MPLSGQRAGTLVDGVQHAAESLSGIVIHQTVAGRLSYGAPLPFDMRTGNTLMGAIDGDDDAAYAQVGNRCTCRRTLYPTSDARL
jgi:trimethylamine:corrinoid methyltransferase-like protein